MTVDNTTDNDLFRLDEPYHYVVFREIETQALATTTAAARPVAIILGGQPGAGKAALASAALDELGGNAVKVDADELRKHHPWYLSLMLEDDRTAADRTHSDAGRWAVKLTNSAIAARRHVVVDGTMRDPNSLAKLCQKFKDAGYRVEARVMAVNSLVSRVSIHERYERQVQANGFGRWSNQEKHDASFEGVPLTVAKLEADQLVDRMSVYARNSYEPIYDNHLVDGTWNQPIAGAECVVAERERDWTPSEKQQFTKKLDAIAAHMEQRGANDRDRAALRGLRDEFHRNIPGDESASRVERSARPKLRG